MFTTLPPGLATGRYIVRWKSFSDEDGERDEGAFCFYVGVEPTAAQAAECAAFDEEDGTAPPTVPAPTATEPSAPTATEPAPVPTATATLENPDEDGGGAPIGAIVGGVIGAVVVVALIAGGFVWLRRARA